MQLNKITTMIIINNNSDNNNNPTAKVIQCFVE